MIPCASCRTGRYIYRNAQIHGIIHGMKDKNTKLEMLSAREQLMSDIECIIESFFYDTWGDEYNQEQNELVTALCDAVCANFPSN